MELKELIKQASGLQPELRRLLIAIVDNAESGSGQPVTVAWGSITGKPATYPPAIGNTATTAMAGNTVIPPAPATGTAAQLQEGTETVAKVWTAKDIHDEIARQIAAIQPTP